jgi:hypothetical protein
MAEITYKQRRRGFMFADLVAAMDPEYFDPATRRDINRLVRVIRKRCGFNRDQKKNEVLRCVRDGAASTADLINETNFHIDDILELARELESEGKVTIKKMSLTGKGRPTIMITAVVLADSSCPESGSFSPLKIN